MLGLPDDVRAFLFDLDGVLTQTANVHAAAWKQMFDDYLRARAGREGSEFVPFDIATDYTTYVDGKPRYDGTRSFLESRGIHLPEGDPDDPPDAETVCGLGNRKNQLVMALIQRDGVEPYEGSVRYLQAVKDADMPRAVVSSSANCKEVLEAAGIIHFFDTFVDGNVTAEQHLSGKPAPDTYLYAAKLLGVEPSEAAVFEDALSGVQSGHAGGFVSVVGVDRVDHADALAANGATIVVEDLGDLLEGVGDKMEGRDHA